MHLPIRWRPLRAATAAVLLGALVAGCTGGSSPGPTGTAQVERDSVLDPWFDAVEDADDSAANIVVLGDSVSEGHGLTMLQHRWIDRLQWGLRERSSVEGCPTGPGGYRGTSSLVPADYWAPGLPDPVVRGTTRLAPSVGPGGRARTLAPGASISWTATTDAVDIGYRTRADGGPMQVLVDGQIPLGGMAVPTEGKESQRRVWSSRDLGQGQHTITARNASEAGSGQVVTVTDLTPYRGDRDRCVHVLDASRSGMSVRTITRTPTYLEDALSLDPDLLIVPLGFNDGGAGVPASTFGKSLDTLITQTRAKGYGGPILLVGLYTPAASPGRPGWPSYLEQMRTRTRHEAVSFVDLSTVLPRADPSTRNYRDGLHASQYGQRMISDALIDPLVPPARSVDKSSQQKQGQGDG